MTRVKTKFARTVLAVAGVLVAASASALDLNDMMMPADGAGWHLSEAVILTVLGVMFLMLARAVRREPKVELRLSPVRPHRVRLPLNSTIESVAKSA